MWLASCWGQVVNSVTELNVGVVVRGGLETQRRPKRERSWT